MAIIIVKRGEGVRMLAVNHPVYSIIYRYERYIHYFFSAAHNLNTITNCNWSSGSRTVPTSTAATRHTAAAVGGDNYYCLTHIYTHNII